MSTIVKYDLNKKANKVVFGTIIVNRIDNPFDPLNSKVTKTDIHGGKLSSYLEGYCLGADIKVALNGKIFTGDYNEYIVQPNDTITYTNVIAGGGGGGGKQIVAMVAMIALAVVTAGMAVPAMYGAMGYAGMAAAFEAGAYGAIALVTLGTMGIMIAGSLLINSFISQNASGSITSSTPETESSTYSWNGVTTSRELNKPIPVLYGTHALGGTVINSRFYYKDSDDWLATQLALCQGEVEYIQTDNIRVNDSTLSSFISQSAVVLQQRSGTQNQSIMTGYSDSIYNNTGTAKELKYNIPYQFTTESTNIDFFRLHFIFPEGLYKIDTSTGNKTTNTVTFTAQYRKVGTSTWYNIYDYDSRGIKEYHYTFERASRYESYYGGEEYYYSYTEWTGEDFWSTDPNLTSVPGSIRNFRKQEDFRFNANLGFVPSTTLTFSAKSSVPIKKYFEPVDERGAPILLEQAQYEIKVTRTSADDDINGYNRSTSTFRFIEEINTLDINYGGIALLGIDLKATDMLSSARPNFSVVARRAPLYIAGNWYTSDNPANVCLDILTNSSYGMGIDISEIDLPSFDKWREFCEGGAITAFTLTKSVQSTVANQDIFGNAIAIPASDLPAGEHLVSLSQLNLNNSTLSSSGIVGLFGVQSLTVNDIIGLSYTNINGIYYYLLHMRYSPKSGRSLSYNLSFSKLNFTNMPKLKFNGVFDTSSDVWTSLQDAAQIGRGQVVLRGNKYSCVYDAPKTIKGLFNAANSKNVTVQYLNNADIASEIELQFSDSNINYEMNSISVQDADAMSSGIRSNKTTRQVKGITSEADALIYGRYMLATSKFIRRIITFDADIESITQTIGDLVAVQTDVTQYGIGGLVERVFGDFIFLDNTVILEKGKTYTIKIKNKSTDVIREFEFLAQDTSKELTFDSLDNTYTGSLTFDDFALLVSFESSTYLETSVILLDGTYDVNIEDRYTFGIKGSDSILCTITNIDRDGDLNRKITATEYNESILDFNYDNDMLQRVTPTLRPKNGISNFKASDRLVKLAAGQVVAMVSFGWEAKISSSYNIYLLEANGFKHYLGNNIKETRFEYPNTVLAPEIPYTIYIEDVEDPSIVSTLLYTVTAFSAPPGNIPSMTYSTAGANILFTVNYPNKPLDFAYYNIFRDNLLISTQISDTFELRHLKGTSNTTYSVQAVDMIKKVSAKTNTVFTPIMPVITALDWVTTGENINLTISVTKGSFDIDYYTLTYNGTTVVVKDLSILVKANFTGTKTFTVKATDILGNDSTTFSKDVTITVPTPLNLKSIIEGKEAVISWDIPTASIPIDYYEVTYDSITVKTKTNNYRLPVFWGGTKTFNVSTVNVLNAKSSAISTSVTISAGTVSGLLAEVVDNNVLLRWSSTQGSLPIDTFLIYKGPNVNSLISIGEKKGTFTTIFESASGTYTYWICAVDSAGNQSAKVSTTTSVSEPPDYVLTVNWKSTFNGTKSNAKQDTIGLVLPVNTAETIQQHFVNNSWTTAQAQVTSGNPLWIQPFLSTGYYEETFDYGVALANSLVSVNLDSTSITGTPTIVTKISLSSDNINWTVYDNQTQVYGANFRYVKVRITVTGTNYGTNIKGLEVKLDSKIKNDSGSGFSAMPITTTSLIGNGSVITATFGTQTIVPYQIGEKVVITGAVPATLNGTWTVSSCSYTQVIFQAAVTATATTQGILNNGGTVVKFNKPFVDITAITVTPNSTVPLIAIYDFQDVPAPSSFKVLLYDNAGNRVNGNFSWTAKGY